ncbi:hypothetical protein VTO42DRAFT_5031 [Malbranchea cinnamomea]
MALNHGSVTTRSLSLVLRHTSAHHSTVRQFARYQSTSSSSASSSAFGPSSVSSDELQHFASLARSWWDPQGPSRILHLMNPLRHDFIAACLAGSQPEEQRGLKYLDVGCGGGIFAESLARTIPLSSSSSSSLLSPQTRASSLLAIDPSPTMIELAFSHARKDPKLYAHLQSGKFRYENTTLEALVSSSSSSPASAREGSSLATSKFDVITIFEVLEHVDPHTSSPRSFLSQCLSLLRPGGWLIGSTIARTLPSYFINQVIAEAPWPIGVVPRGTHEWSKFVNVEEVKGWAEEAVAMNSGSSSSGGRDDVSKAYPQMGWRCEGTVYFPGVGWKFVPGAERWGNYFWGIQKMV